MFISIHKSQQTICRGYYAHVCLKCNAIRPFVSANKTNSSGVSVNGLSVYRDEENLGIFISNCTCCGNMIRQKPRKVIKDWNPGDGLPKLIEKTQKGLEFIGKPIYDHLSNYLEELVSNERINLLLGGNHFRLMFLILMTVVISSFALHHNDVLRVGIFPSIIIFIAIIFYTKKLKSNLRDFVVKNQVKMWILLHQIPPQEIIDKFSMHRCFPVINTSIEEHS